MTKNKYEEASEYQKAAFEYADQFMIDTNWPNSHVPPDTMSREERRAWVAAMHYAELRDPDIHNGAKVDFAVFCGKRTDLDTAWGEW